MFGEFQLGMREVLRNSIATGVQTLIQAQQRPPRFARREEQREEDDDEDDVDDDNSFARVGDQQRHDIIAPPRVDNRRWDSGFKLELPDFSGGLQPEAFLDWLSTTEELLNFKEVPDAMRVALVATRFKGRASAWWQQIKETRARAGKERVSSWDKMQKLMRKAFLPYNYSRTMYTKFQNLRQGSKSVDEYASDFFSLLARNKLMESEEQLVSRFIGGLRLQIQNMLLQFNPLSVSEAHQRALLIEQQTKNSASNWRAPSGNQRGVVNSDPSNSRSLEQSSPFTSRQHDSPETTMQRSTKTSTIKCFGCGEQGHRQSSCPHQSRRGFLAEEEPIYDEETFDHGDFDEQVQGDTGVALVIRRNCLVPQVVNESWLRTNIFRTTCTIRGKVCRLIIDSGSCTNVISAEAVDKLALFKETHPAPYRLAWLNSNTDM